MFFSFLLTGNASKNLDKKLVLSDYQLVEFFDLIKQARGKYKKSELYIFRSGSFGENKNKNSFYCPAIKNSIVITPDNKIYPCIF